MSESELGEVTQASVLVDALFRQGLRSIATPPAEQVWQRIMQQVQAVEPLHHKVSFDAVGIPPLSIGMGATYLLGMPVRGSV